MVLQKQLVLKKVILSRRINGSEISSWSDVVEIFGKIQMKNLIFQSTVMGRKLKLLVTPIERTVEGKKMGMIGVYSPVEKSPLQAINTGFKETYYWTKQIFVMLGKLVTGAIFHRYAYQVQLEFINQLIRWQIRNLLFNEMGWDI